MPSSLSNRLDLDVYHVVKKLEQTSNDGKPFKTVSTAYNAIKSSNSSLGRQKKRPLEDSLFRVLDVRKQEEAQNDSDDSEAAIDVDEPESKGDSRFLLNKQITKHWNVEPAAMPQATNGEPPAKKKRRVDTDGDDRNNARATSEGATTAPVAKDGKATDGSKLQKKTTRGPSFEIESDIEPPQLGGLGIIYDAILLEVRKLMYMPSDFDGLTFRRRRLLGMLLTGPSGVGKRSYIRSIASQLDLTLINITSCFYEPERFEKNLTEAFDTAIAAAPCIVYIKHIEKRLPKSSEPSQSEQHDRMLDFLKKQIKRATAQNALILCMATATREIDVNPALLAIGMFEEHFQLRVPTVKEREEILRVQLEEDFVHEEIDLASLAKKLDGFVAEDIEKLARRAGSNAGSRRIHERCTDIGRWLKTKPLHTPELEAEEAYITEDDYSLKLEDFNLALKDFVPMLRKEGFTATPTVTWDQVGGLAAVRQQLEISVVFPILRPEVYEAVGMTGGTGCLLWGPPGCGKTLIAQAVANEAQASFILINGPELLNKYVGESERAVRELFSRARSSTPCILFFDEFDSVVPRRDGAASEAGTRVVNTLLAELDGAQDRSGIYVIGTTNRPDMIDEAILRPGRLSEQLFLDLPTPEERVEILRAIYRSRNVAASEAELAALKDVALDPRCQDFSGADLSGLHRKAGESALTRYFKEGGDGPKLIGADWENALSMTRRSVKNPEMYRKLRDKLARSG